MPPIVALLPANKNFAVYQCLQLPTPIHHRCTALATSSVPTAQCAGTATHGSAGGCERSSRGRNIVQCNGTRHGTSQKNGPLQWAATATKWWQGEEQLWQSGNRKLP